MKLRIRKSTTIITTCLAFAGFLLVSGVVFASFNKPALAQGGSGRLVTVYDRGTATTFITQKDTLEEAFDEQGISVDARDAVEPSLDEKLVAPDYQVNIYRARPVTVIDGATRQKVITPYQSAERIAKDAGIKLYEEDEALLSRSTDFVGAGAGLQLTVDRATLVSLDLFGRKAAIRTQGETVGEMLEEKGIQLSQNSRASVDLSTPISDGMKLRVWQEGEQTITVDESVAFSVKKIEDADRPAGYKQIQTKGVNGKRTVTYQIEIKNGKEISREEIASIKVKASVQQVEIIGTKPNFIPYTGGGTRSDWLQSSNIPEESWGYADFMVQRESGWNPNAVNVSSGACGLAQALPCSKLGPQWNNPIVALNWMNGYVNGRYGGWEGAYNFWQANHWY